MHEVILPELGEGITKAVIACWHYQSGDRVKADDDIVELVTDKATFNVCAGQDGQLKKIFFKEGQEASIGALLAVIE